jgi:hypothetical protein
MGGRNLARVPLSKAALTAMLPGTPVIDANMDIYVRRADGLWEGGHRVIGTGVLLLESPVRRWYGAVRKGAS